ncbi:MAG: 6-phosphogluconolactonase [Acidobacteriales bacterium]|nr:6-phosphogluconolactonase [Terriglobales bacterium]
MELRTFAEAGELFKAAAGEFLRLAEEAVCSKGLFTVCLSGGSTPRRLYSLLGNDPEWKVRIPWATAHFFWSDERHVPPDDQESNFRMAWETMLCKVTVPPGNIHRIPAEQPDAGRAALEYNGVLRDFFKLGDGQFPRFDLALLGMGADGHTASLFPDSGALHEERRMVVSNWVERLETERITMTAPVLNNASHVFFLVLGEDKASALKAVLQGPRQPDLLPAQMIRPAHGSLLWLVDRHAASLLGP